MDLSNFTFTVTDNCNYNCSYCYQIKKSASCLGFPLFRKAFDFFFPAFKPNCLINFSGGEPLLEFDLIRKAVSYSTQKAHKDNKPIRFCLTTNGSLINNQVIGFLNQHHFKLLVSFDGTAQDISREKGSFAHMTSVLEDLKKCPAIELATNSVFAPENVDNLVDSLKFITQSGIKNAHFALANLVHWNESHMNKFEEALDELKKFALFHFRSTGTIPLSVFRDDKQYGIFSCAAAKKSMTLTPDHKLWGCYLFPDYFKINCSQEEKDRFCFGDLETFIINPHRIYSKTLQVYANLKMNNYSSNGLSCSQCLDIIECKICPLEAAMSSHKIGEIPGWRCQAGKIIRRTNKQFWYEANRFQSTDNRRIQN